MSRLGLRAYAKDFIDRLLDAAVGDGEVGAGLYNNASRYIQGAKRLRPDNS